MALKTRERQIEAQHGIKFSLIDDFFNDIEYQDYLLALRDEIIAERTGAPMPEPAVPFQVSFPKASILSPTLEQFEAQRKAAKESQRK